MSMVWSFMGGALLIAVLSLIVVILIHLLRR